MRHVYRVTVVVAAVVMLAATAWATTAIRMSNADLASEADLIVIGRGVESRTAWVGRILFTYVTVSVSESLKGTAGETITVAIPGGIDANRKFPIAMTYAGAPAIRSNEDVFLFLSHDSDLDAYFVMGFSQGKFSIVSDPQGKQYVTRDLTGIRLQGGTGAVRGTVSYTPLAEFRSEIQGYVAQ